MTKGRLRPPFFIMGHSFIDGSNGGQVRWIVNDILRHFDVSHKLDIFETLEAIDKRNFNFWDSLTDEERKGFAPPVVLRWLSSVEGDVAKAAQYLWLTNDQVNVDFWSIYEHPELQFKLMASVGLGTKQRHKWIAGPKRPNSGGTLQDFLLERWPDANDFELKIILSKFDPESFEDFVKSAGRTPQEENELLDSYAKVTGTKSKAKKKGKPKGK